MIYLDAGLLVRPFEDIVTTDIGYDIVTTERDGLRPEVDVFVSWILEASEQAA